MRFTNSSSSPRHFVLILAMLFAMFGLQSAAPVQADTLTVTNTDDSGPGSLRQAIEDAAPGDTITFDASLAGGIIVLDSSLSIDKDLTVDASGLDPHVQIDSAAVGGDALVVGFLNSPAVTLDSLDLIGATQNSILQYGGSLSISNGTFSGNASSIHVVDGTLNVANCSFSNNGVMGGTTGGLVLENGTVTVADGAFSGNQGDTGAAIDNQNASLTVTGSQFSGNSAAVGGAIFSGGTTSISDSDFLNNSSTNNGGAIQGGGSLTIDSSNFSNNDAGTEGGAVSGSFTITDSSFSDNSAGSSGGALSARLASNIGGSTFSGNSAAADGGALYFHTSTTLLVSEVYNSTFDGNTAGDHGGGLFNDSELSVVNSTFSGNGATTGAGLYNAPGRQVNPITYKESDLHLHNTILANSAPDSDCFNDAAALETGTNLIETNGSAGANLCGSAAVSDDPDLGSLADNGGPTQTMALLPGSPAIDAGDDTVCAAGPINNLDQRGVVRPQDLHCDLGAYEFFDDIDPEVSAITRADADPTAAASVNFAVTFSEDVSGLDAGDFELATTGVSGAGISEVSGGDASYTVSVATGTGDGTIGLDVIAGASIADLAGNPLASGFDTGETYTVARLTPALLAPAEGEQLLNNRPAFDWTDAPGATKYGIQIARDLAFTSLVTNTSVLQSNYMPSADLPAGLTLYWRVNRYAGGAAGPWSGARSLTAARPPSIPLLVSPGNNAVITDYTPRLDWSSSGLPSGISFLKYEFQLSEGNATFASSTSVDVAGPAGNSEHTLAADLNPNVRYYWRVRAFNTLGQYSAWSTVWSFRTAILPPGLEAPADGATLNLLRPAFDWQNVSGAGSYTIQVSKVVNFSVGVVVNSTVNGGTNSTFTPVSDLPAGSTLHWRVRANPAAGSFGPGAWSAVRSLSTPRPPSVPALISPANNVLITSLNNAYQPRLDWYDSTMSPYTSALFDHYQVQVADASTFASTFIDENVGISEFTGYAAPLVPNTKYYWRVRAWDNAGNLSSWSAVRTMRAALLPPVLDAPAGGALLDHPRPAFDWEDVTGATSYSLQVSAYANLGSPLINVTPAGSAYTPPLNLPAARLLYWRVRANGPNGPSLWSEVRSFTTGNPPSIPGLVSPANAALVPGPSPLFDWSNATLPPGTAFGHYQLQIASDSGFASIVHDNDLPGIANSEDNSAVLTTGLTYFWRVRAFSDVLHYSAWSAVRSVKINIAVPALSLQPFATGFANPVHITHAGDGSGRIFVVEKCGTIRIIENGTTLAADFLDMSGRVSCGGERGLLSVAFPPDYSSKQYFYIFYTDPDGALTVSRFSVPIATPDQADAGSEEVLLSIPHPNGNHNGGQLAFGNDGYLYISTGDGGGGGDPNNNGQNANVLLGKILRIDVESGAPTYAVPPSNPFYGVSGKKAEIWALGLRNPWRISFDRLTHDLYIADVGQTAWEEVDFQPASSPGGVNYGWRLREGNHCYNPSSGCGTPPNYSAPVAEYSHDLGCSVTGGFVYRGPAYPGLQGFYLYSDFCSGRIWVLQWWNGNWYGQMALNTPRAPSTFGEDEQGNLYLGDLYNGTIYTVEAAP